MHGKLAHWRYGFVFATGLVMASSLRTDVLADEGSASRPNILFCVSDNQYWRHAGAYGSKMVRTPAFDRIAREGILFNNAYSSCPSCGPSRASILTGQAFYRIEEGAQNFGTLDKRFAVYPDLLEAAGYHVGFTGKGWSPGDWKAGGRARNPAGKEYNARLLTPPTANIASRDYAANFADFLDAGQEAQPFCFWFGASEPHRPYEKGSGLRAGKTLHEAELPPILPDVEEVRGDFLDYALEIEWFDQQLAAMIQLLEERARLENTMIIVTSDNGPQFPRGIANLYDFGTRMPLAIRWGKQSQGGRVVDDFISFADFAPTFLEVAGIKPPMDMTGRSFFDILRSKASGQIDPQRDHVIIGRERHHVDAFPGLDGDYPGRALRTHDYLYIVNDRPDRPAGGEAPDYADIDAGPTRDFMLAHRTDDSHARTFVLCFGSRPGEELYDLRHDPEQINNVADRPEYADIKTRLKKQLENELRETNDPRAFGKGERFERYPIRGYTLPIRTSKPRE